jgi:periplasmic divalent cation tolerance protein
MAQQHPTDYVLCMTTVNKENDIDKIINSALTKRLCACINILYDVESFYHWRGKIKQDKETILLFKTKVHLIEELKKDVLINHSYELPEFIVVPITEGGLHFFSWIDREVKKEESKE